MKKITVKSFYLSLSRTLSKQFLIGHKLPAAGYRQPRFFYLLFAACYLLLVFVVSCGGISDLKKYLGMIGQFQIVSVMTAPPEVRPGETVTLSAVAVNPKTWGTADDQIVYSWVFLNLDTNGEMPGGITYNINKFTLSDYLKILSLCPQTPGCELQMGETNPWTVTVPAQVPGEGESLSYNVFLVAADSAATLSALIQGQKTTGKYALGIKSIKVSQATQYNHNPIIQEVFCDPATQDVSTGRFQASPGETYTLHARVTDLDAGDLIVYRWLILAGRLDSSNQEEVKWTAPDDPDLYPIFLVVRDKQIDFLGGQAEREIQVEVSN
ncbi:MAG: hypothetical protein PHE84_13050 [bacterium]|nr:hypothetical protein [bacterium]